MSGRRRRDDGWDDGHQNAQEERRDPWADNSGDEWGDRDLGPASDAAWSDAAIDAAWSQSSGDGRGTGGYPARGRAGAYGASDATGKGYSPAQPPEFPTFQAANGNGRGPSAGGQAVGYASARNGADRYGAGPGYGGERGAVNGRGAAGHSAAGYGANGYQDSGYGRAGNAGNRPDPAGYDPAQGGRRNGSGYGGNGRPGGSAQAPEFTPADSADMDEDGPAGTPRPYGRLSIYTLHEDKTREFDRLAERAAEGVRAAEPDTLVYVIHVVPKAPMQRIIYEIYRDRAAFLTHERQPHIRQFAADRATCVLATNIIDLRLKYAKVAALGPAAESPPPAAGRTPRTPEPAAGNDRYQAAGGQSPAAQQQPAQYSPTQYSRAQQPGAASFTPATDQYADIGQPTVGREAFRPAAQYGSNGTGGYAPPTAQYGTASANPGAAGYANGGSYSSANGYQSPNGYPASNGYGAAAGGYSAANGYQGANGYAEASGSGYANGNGYSAANGYPNDGSYQNGSGYANGNGYSAANGYPNGSSYQNGNGYGSNGAATQGPQYTPRYRELTSGEPADDNASGYPDNGGRRADGRQQYRPQQTEWPPRSQDQR